MNAAAVSALAVGVVLVSAEAAAQPQIGPAELAGAKTVLDAYRAQLTAEQFALLSRKLAAAESAYAELTTVARAGRVAVAASEGSAAATGARAFLGGVAELLPFLMLVWPSTAPAPPPQPE